MSRPIRFASTRWGKVAYSVTGSGQPLLFETGWIGHLEHLWEEDGYRGLVERLALSHEVLCFDPPGTGLSDRGDPLPGSIDQEVQVLETVVGAAGWEKRPISMFCSSIAASTAVSWAATHPRRVRRLALFGATLRGSDLGSRDAQEALLTLVRTHWGLGSTTLRDIFAPDLPAASRHWLDGWQRLSADGSTAARRLEMYYGSDVSTEAAQVTVPTMVIHRSHDRAVPVHLAFELASAIDGATLATVDGSAHLCFLGDWESVADLVVPFLEAPDASDLPRGPYGEFTAREFDVAALTVEGLSNSAIGERLGISARTVETHLSRIRSKLGVGTRAEVAAWMARRSEFR